MKDRPSNFRSELEFSAYYRLNNPPKSMSLIEAECLDIPADTTKDHQTSETGIIVALGFIATLLLLSGIQLHNSLSITPTEPKISKGQKLSTFDMQRYSTSRLIRKLNREQSQPKIDFYSNERDISIIHEAIRQAKQSTIAEGKF